MEADKSVAIAWNEDIDSYMTHAKSSDPLLERFFSVREWNFVRYLYRSLVHESAFEFEQSRVEFEYSSVVLSDHSSTTRVDKEVFLKISLELFDIVIVGANSDHHSVRYEPWWHEFTESAYQLRRKTELL